MRRVIALADEAVKRGGSPFSALIVSAGNEVLFAGTNISTSSGNPLDHAEMHALRSAYREHGIKALAAATLYANVEPCVMCAGAILWFGIGRVVYGAAEHEIAPYFPKTIEFCSYPSAPTFAAARGRIRVRGGVLAKDSLAAIIGWADRDSRECLGGKC
jgi:tRNA(Arg) A34 adenosine deaminase TadA